MPGYEHDPHARFWSVASLLYSPDKEEALKKEPQPSEVHGAVLPPDEHLACFDYLYYLCAQVVRDLSSTYESSPERRQPFEYNFDISPAWRFVLKHFRWTKRLQAIADGYLRLIFEIPDHEPIPPVSMDLLTIVPDDLFRHTLSTSQFTPAEMTFVGTVVMYRRKIAFPPFPFISVVSLMFNKMCASDWVSHLVMSSCSVMKRILLGGTRSVMRAGIRPATLQKMLSTSMVHGDTFCLRSVFGHLFHEFAGIRCSSMSSFSLLASA